MNEIAELFHRLTLGVYIIGAAHDERRDAFTAAWVMQAALRSWTTRWLTSAAS